ncbi:MAG: hypothetical protein R3246_16440, partial [Acidimicrobiia bacterium]|nr:hypothetical protein [Acidimicrobiia bacterium]
VMLIATAATRHEVESKGRGAVGTLLGDGRRVRGRTAHREAERARTVSTIGRLRSAVEAGRVGAAQVDAISAAIKGLSDEELGLLDTDELVDAAVLLPADVFARQVRREAERIKGDHGLGATTQRQARSSWKHWFDERSGMGHVHGQFDPERDEAITGSVEGELTRLANEGGVTKDNRLAADAAYGLLTGQATHRSSGRPHITVVVDWETFSRGGHDASVRETGDGHRLSPESISRLACDATIQRVVLDSRGVPVDVGRRSRTATDTQWQTIRAIYRTCAWHGCHRPISWCQLHHVHEWDHGGPTDLCNLIPLCSRHHHDVHEGGWSVKLHAHTRQLDIHSPDGHLCTTTRPDRTATSSPLRDEPAAAMAP